jgi:RNA polymerase sigma-70 factor (ECF subfamily)
MKTLEKSFESLSREHADAIYRFFMYRSYDRALAEDLTQETFLKAWKYWPLRQEKSLRAWLYTIASNLFTDHLRHQAVVKKHRQIAETQERSREKRLVSIADAGFEKNIMVREILDKLDAEAREVLILREMDNLTIDEICQQTTLSRDRVRYRLRKAREEFVRHYNKKGDL